VLDLWRDKLSPRKVLNLIDQLPGHSCYAEAIAQDDELAGGATTPAGKYRPRVTEWSPTEQLLAAVFDRLGEVVAATVAGAGGDGRVPEAWPRPETAAERVLKAQQAAEWDDLFDVIEKARHRGSGDG
jgi:hypothetical protein